MIQDQQLHNDYLKKQFEKVAAEYTGYNTPVDIQELEKALKGTFTSTTSEIKTDSDTVNDAVNDTVITDDGLTAKERLVQDLVIEGAIDIKEAMILLEKDVKVVEVPKPDDGWKDMFKPHPYDGSGTPYWMGTTWTCSESTGVKPVSNFA